MTASKSKWLVGSSKNSTSGSTNNALAMLSLIYHPPDNEFIGLFIISWLNPNPFNILDALAGYLSASMNFNCSYTLTNSLAISFYLSSSWLSFISIDSSNTFSFSNKVVLSTSLSNIYCSPDKSLSMIS